MLWPGRGELTEMWPVQTQCFKHPIVLIRDNNFVFFHFWWWGEPCTRFRRLKDSWPEDWGGAAAVQGEPSKMLYAKVSECQQGASPLVFGDIFILLGKAEPDDIPTGSRWGIITGVQGAWFTQNELDMEKKRGCEVTGGERWVPGDRHGVDTRLMGQPHYMVLSTTD